MKAHIHVRDKDVYIDFRNTMSSLYILKFQRASYLLLQHVKLNFQGVGVISRSYHACVS